MTMNLHIQQPVVTRGAPLTECRVVAVMIHGRGQTTDDILELVDRIGLSEVHYVALQAAGNSWYPQGFMAPLEDNQPDLNHALECYHERIQSLIQSGVQRTKIVLIGFSQGACLTAEYAVKHADRYGGILLFTGGVIGPEGTKWEYGGNFQNTPVFLGSSDVDGWVPEPRVHETDALFHTMGAKTLTRIYSGMEHIVNEDEVSVARTILQEIQSI